MEIRPAKRAWGGVCDCVCVCASGCDSPSIDSVPGMCVREALLKPPMSASLMTLHPPRADSSSKRTKGNGWLGLCRPSRRTAILDWRLSSSMERRQKPGWPALASRMGVANIVDIFFCRGIAEEERRVRCRKCLKTGSRYQIEWLVTSLVSTVGGFDSPHRLENILRFTPWDSRGQASSIATSIPLFPFHIRHSIATCNNKKDHLLDTPF